MREFIDVQMSRRVQHPDGFVTVPAHVARVGVQYYRAFELDLSDGDPLRVIAVHRPPEEVFAPQSISTYSGTPITNEHVGKVTPQNWRELAIGTVTAPRQDGIFVGADLIFHSQDALDAIDAGKKQLSATYDARLEWSNGSYEGTAYDAVQRDIRINSVALVRAARCGAACALADSDTTGGIMGTRRIAVDGIPLELDDVAAASVEKLQAQLASALATIEVQKQSLAATIKYGDAQLTVSNPNAIQAVLDDQAQRIAAMSRDVMTPEQRDAMVADWVKTLDDARRLMPKIVADGKTCAAIRREVVASMYEQRKPLIDAVLSGKAFNDADDGSIRTAFAVLATTSPHEPSSPRRDPVALALTSSIVTTKPARDEPQHATTADGLSDPDAARTQWMNRQRERMTAHASHAKR